MNDAFCGLKSLKKSMIANWFVDLLSIVSLIAVIGIVVFTKKILAIQTITKDELHLVFIFACCTLAVSALTTRIISLVCFLKWKKIRFWLFTKESKIIGLPWFIKRIRFYLIMEMLLPFIFSWILFCRLRNLNNYVQKEIVKPNINA